jgi:DNA-binding transcriptional ArsR family regulator
MAKFLLVLHSYAMAQSEVIEVYGDRLVAVNGLQEYVVNFLQNKDGIDRIGENSDRALKNYTLFAPAFGYSESRLRRHLTALPNGHYVVADPRNYQYRWEIWQRSEEKTLVRGIIFNSEYTQINVNKVFNISLVRMPEAQGTKCEPGDCEYVLGSGLSEFADAPFLEDLRAETPATVSQLREKYPESFALYRAAPRGSGSFVAN